MTAPTVETSIGTLRGSERGAVDAFLGIPYADAPVGSRRWAPPAPPQPWTGVRDATAPGPPPPQPARPVNRWFHGELPVTEESGCLTLNVWVPRGERERPVLVWLHGGGWALGWGSAAIFDGAALAEALDAVVVTCNYRLGPLGWLHHPLLESPHGDWGFLDQAAVLAWVGANAAAFGGVPDRITLAGESAGATNLLHHLVSETGAGGLFQRAIALSPGLGAAVIPPGTAVGWAEALAGHLVGGFDLEALRAVPAERVLAAHEELLGGLNVGSGGGGPLSGGALPVALPGAIAADPAEVPAANLGIPILIGTTADEATFLFRLPGRRLDPDEDQLRAIVGRQRGVTDAAATVAAYREREPDADPTAILCRIVTDKLFVEPAHAWAQARAEAGGEVYRCRIEHRSPIAELGATHSIDVPLLFGSFRNTANGAEIAGVGARTEAASAALQSACRAFVHGEDPWAPAELRIIG